MSWHENEITRIRKERELWNKSERIKISGPSSFNIRNNDLKVTISPMNDPDPFITFLEGNKTLWKAPLTEDFMQCLDITKVQVLIQVGDRDRQIRACIQYFEKLLGEINANS